MFVGSPAVVHVWNVLKLKNARRKAFFGSLNWSANQLRNICSSARDWNPTSFVSKPGEKRWYTLWKRVNPPPNLLSVSLSAFPDNDVRVGSKVRLSSGR